MAADDLITFDELRARLTELDSVRKTVERELTVMRSRKDQLYELERDRDALLESYARRTPDDLDALTAEERHQVYKMLAPKVVAMPDESLEVSGAFGDGLGVCQSDTERSRPSTRKTRPCTATFSTASGHSSRRWRA